ncbi:MAG: ribosome-binding factor A [Alphaproteobacteria bacterium]|nr:MAG: ribosome-binding factor A [Alphaproteobacteria bacterium]
MTNKPPSQRQLRVGEMVRHALSGLLQRGEVADATIARTVVSVTEVAMSPDLRIATVFVSPLGGGDPQPLIKALAANARLIRGRLSPALRQLKYMPELRFRADTSFDTYARIDALLHEPHVARDLKPDEDAE